MFRKRKNGPTEASSNKASFASDDGSKKDDGCFVGRGHATSFLAGAVCCGILSQVLLPLVSALYWVSIGPYILQYVEWNWTPLRSPDRLSTDAEAGPGLASVMGGPGAVIRHQGLTVVLLNYKRP